MTAGLLGAEANRSFDGANCLAPRWRKFQARLDDQLRGRQLPVIDAGVVPDETIAEVRLEHCP